MKQGARTDLAPVGAKSQSDVAQSLGVSRRTVQRATAILREAPDIADKITAGELTLRSAMPEIKRRRRAQIREVITVPIDKHIIVGDFREHDDKVKDGSVSLIFTDPPYDRKADELLDGLGSFAMAKLAEGGSLICYVGQTQLPIALDAFRQYLRYWWIIACFHSGGATLMHEYGIKACWKAVLWFVKGTRHDERILVEDVMSGGKQKDRHPHQQAESEARYWIEKLSTPDGLICDPFLGSGTTGLAARNLNRPWIGFEIDEDIALETSRMLNEPI